MTNQQTVQHYIIFYNTLIIAGSTKKIKITKKINMIIVIIIQYSKSNYTNNNNNSRDSKRMVMTDFSSKHFSFSKLENQKHSSEQCQERKLEEINECCKNNSFSKARRPIGKSILIC